MNFKMPGPPFCLFVHLMAVTALILLTATGHAQGFDCTKARDAVDQAICASPRLRQLDADLARAYAEALTRDPARTDTARQEQRSWARSRSDCLPVGAAIPRKAEACLIDSYTSRLAALTPAQTAATQPAADVTLSAAATLERVQFPSAGETDVLLHVTTPGRFAIRAGSPTGTALQLVDMLTGPGDSTGWPGKQDGRIDALLDTGTYKLRAFGDPAGNGETSLTVTAFTEAGPAQRAPAYQPLGNTLDDLQERSWWLVVTDDLVPARIEAAGRALGALKMWRDGRDLVALNEQTGSIASPPAHPLNSIVLSGRLPPGTYRITAYGGPKLPWTDGATDTPLYLRTGYGTDLLAGGVTGQVGMFGTEQFRLAPNAAQALLILPQPAAAQLSIGGATVDVAPTNRSRMAMLDLPTSAKADRVVTLQAQPGQQFALRPLEPAGSLPDKPGRVLLAAVEPANGGDEVPGAAILARMRTDSTADVMAAPGVPDIGPGRAWRTRFNLRGATFLLFHVTAPVTIAVRTEGPPVTPRVLTLQNAVMNAQGDGRAATSWALSPGWYTLALSVPPAAVGILDLTLGPAGVTPPAPNPTGPEAPTLPLGELTLNPPPRIALYLNHGPEASGRLLVRPLPAELADGPLVQTLAAGEVRSIDVHVAAPGTLVVRDLAAASPLESRPVAANTNTTVALPAADHPRTLAITLLPPAQAGTATPEPAPNLPRLQAGQPAFLDLARDASAQFGLTVGQGGLYRVETLGRLKTAGTLGTAFVPDLGQASANGIGNNMLLQRYLRAGQYRVEITAHGSSGRLGVAASAAPLDQGADLLPGLSARASLAPAHGVAFPIRITIAGRYHLDLLGDGRVFTTRLEDADGWPLVAAGKVSTLDQDLTQGTYRLIVQPESVQARVVARLHRIETPVPLTGHGPHPLPFETTRSLEWREPANRNDPRTEDTWTFALAGPAAVTLQLDGDGMTAALRPAASRRDTPPLARVLGGATTTAHLDAGEYQVAASALGRNDRLAYSITVRSAELQPDAPRTVSLPTDLPFAIATPRVVTLTSFGDTPLSAELRDQAGNTLTRAIGRTDDWNIAVSRVLPAGQYHLALAPLRAPQGQATSRSQNSSQDTQSTDDTTADQPTPNQDPQDQDQSNQDQAQEQPAQDPDMAQSADADSDTDQPRPTPRTEVTLVLPQHQAATQLPADGTLVLDSGGIQHIALPAAPVGALLVTAAEAPVELILTLERKTEAGDWQSAGQSQGRAPLLAIPVGDAATSWRASLWTVDGGSVPIHFAARAVTAAPAQVGRVALTPVALDGITQHWNAGLVADPDGAILRLTDPDPALLVATAPEQPAVPPAGDTIVAQSNTVWLLSPNPAPQTLATVQSGQGSTIPLSLPTAGKATIPIASPHSLCAFVATSGLGQPGIEAGRGMDLTHGTAFALCGAPRLTAWNAGGSDSLRLHLRRQDLAIQPETAVDAVFAGTLPPHAALPLRLPAGLKRLDVSLASGSALIAGWHQPTAVTAWAGDAPLTRTLTGDWTEAVLVNTGDTPQPAALSATTVTEPASLAPGAMVRRFYGAAGSFVLPLVSQPGQTLTVTGAATASVQRPGGQVRAGITIPLDGPATAVITHRAGPVAVWLDGAGLTPWPQATPRDVSLPQRLPLAGEAMALRFSPGAPILLRITTTGPVILALGGEPPALFDKGAALARYLPTGETTLRLLSPQDGPLSGTLELSASPVTETREGLGTPVAIAPGSAAVFGFTVTAAGPVGLGVRANPDRVTVRLLDDRGTTIQRGVSMLRQLQPGHYLLEASVPPDAPTTMARPAVLGIAPHPNPPPPDIVRGLLIAAGFAPPDAAR